MIVALLSLCTSQDFTFNSLDRKRSEAWFSLDIVMPKADSWHIKSRAHRCSVSEKPFGDGEAFFTAIFPDLESEGYLRLDFSQNAWESREESAPSPFSFWRTIYRPPEVEQKIEIVDKDDPEALLTSLIEQDEAHTENTRYILAVMLERKKILVETDSQKTGTGLLRIYQHRHSGEVFIVKDPMIPLREIAPLQEEVQRLLSPDDPPPATAATGPTVPPANS